MRLLRFPEEMRVHDEHIVPRHLYEHAGVFSAMAGGRRVVIIATVLNGWEHVSVSLQDRCPSWEIMSAVKARFWPPEARVVQYHPPAAEHVNAHPYCLHLWRPLDVEIPAPPAWMVL